MWRFLGGVGSALLLVTAGIFMWRAQAGEQKLIPAMPAADGAGDAQGPLGIADLAGPPTASEKTREEKRFSRYDKDKNGAVARDEYLVARQKNFAKLDLNRDGKLGFDEYAVKAVAKFGAADKDRNGALNAAEFATTRVVRKAKPRPKCAPVSRGPVPAAAEDPPEEG
jgi:hypothetical protein